MTIKDPFIRSYERKLDELAGLSWGLIDPSEASNFTDSSSIKECFDSERYLNDNPSVREAIGKGLVLDAWDHWQKYGRTQRRFARFNPHYEVLNDRHLGKEIYILIDQAEIVSLPLEHKAALKNEKTIIGGPVHFFDSPSYILCSNLTDLIVASKFADKSSSFIYLQPHGISSDRADVLSIPNINFNIEQAFKKRGLPRYLTSLRSPIYGEDKILAAIHLSVIFGASRIILVGDLSCVTEKTDERKYITDLLKNLSNFSVELISTAQPGTRSASGSNFGNLKKILEKKMLPEKNKTFVECNHIINEGYDPSNPGLFISKALGQNIYDIDGKLYVDTAMAAGTAILGHASPLISNAVNTVLENGSLYSRPTLAGRELGYQLNTIFPWFSKFVIATTGSEAIMRLIRIARSVTGRKKIAIFAGSWHGTSDFLLIDDDGTAKEDMAKACLISAGIPDELLSLVTLLPHNSEKALNIIYEQKNELALVLCEPVQGSNPKESDVEFVRRVRETTSSCGVLLAFDEIITGGRLGLSGFQKSYNIYADMAAYGKIIGGGLPIGIVGGTEEIMSSIKDPEVRGSNRSLSGKVVLGGTFSANPITISSALRTIDILQANEEVIYPYIAAVGDRVRTEINDYCVANSINARMYGVGSICRLIMTDQMVRSARHRDDLEPSQQIQKAFYGQILENGIHVGSNRLMFFSLAHNNMGISKVIDAFQFALSKFAKEL